MSVLEFARSRAGISAHALIRSIPLSVVLFAAADIAHAGAGTITVDVKPLSTNVTYSDNPATTPNPLVTFVGYAVTVKNEGGNTINNIRFVGTAAADGPNEIAVYAPSSDGPSCTTSPVQNEISCSIGQLKAGVPFPTFAVFFKAPVKGGSGTDFLRFSGTLFYAEGSPTPVNSTKAWVADPVELGTTNPEKVKSGVRKEGGAIFTGSGIPTPGDNFATSLNVPALPAANSFGFAELFESTPSALNICPSNVACLNFVDVAVKDKEGGSKITFTPAVVTDPLAQYLVVKLVRDSTAFQGSINNVQVYYVSEVAPGSNVGYASIPPCANGGDPLGGQPRCVFSRRVLKKNDPEVKANPQLAGDALIIILETENGRIAW